LHEGAQLAAAALDVRHIARADAAQRLGGGGREARQAQAEVAGGARLGAAFLLKVAACAGVREAPVLARAQRARARAPARRAMYASWYLSRVSEPASSSKISDSTSPISSAVPNVSGGPTGDPAGGGRQTAPKGATTPGDGSARNSSPCARRSASARIRRPMKEQ